MYNNHSYFEILKSSFLIGGGQFFRMLVGIISTKFAAIFIGPSGVGLLGAFQSVAGLVLQISSVGINRSGVRDISASVGSGNEDSVAITVTIMRRMCLLTGLFGALVIISFAVPISVLTFGDATSANEIMLLSVMIAATSVAQGQVAVIQGLRRISELVQLQIFGSVAGALVSIALYAYMGRSGIVPAMLAASLINLIASWWYSKTVFNHFKSLSWKEVFTGAKGLVGLGLAFMIGGLATAFVAYATRAAIVRNLGLDELGVYQASYGISGYVFTFVLGAMGADFYPRLAGVAQNPSVMTRLVNEQIEIGLLLATPVLVATISYGPQIVDILYSSDFFKSVLLLRWFALGCFLKVISWPLGFVMLAKGEKFILLWSEIVFNLLHLILIIFAIKVQGLVGVAQVFVFMYILHAVGMFCVARRLITFVFSSSAIWLISYQVFIVVFVFIVSLVFSHFWVNVIGGVVFLMILLNSIFQLRRRLATNPF